MIHCVHVHYAVLQHYICPEQGSYLNGLQSDAGSQSMSVKILYYLNCMIMSND